MFYLVNTTKLYGVTAILSLLKQDHFLFVTLGLSLSWSNSSWIYNYLCNQCPSSLTFWVRILLRSDVLDTTLCDKVCQWLATGPWFSLGTSVSSTNKTDFHDITEILFKVALNTITITIGQYFSQDLLIHLRYF
jgi:hypothetical protein